jgi:hypothetical protein
MTDPTAAATAKAEGLDAGEIVNPFVFIVGCPRSGTTLLQRMVNAHREIAITKRETHWVPRCFNERIGLTPEGLVTGDLLSWLIQNRHFQTLGIGVDDLASIAGGPEPLPYSKFVTRIFDLYGVRAAKSRVGDKTPGYVRVLSTLHALWPQAKIVHLIRDGRDVCLSLLDWRKSDRILGHFPTWAEDRVLTAALWWSWNVRLGREAGASLGGDLYREIRYEALVAQPLEQCSALSAYLGVQLDLDMLDFNRGRTRAGAGVDAKHFWLPITPGLRDWRSQMLLGDIETFEAGAGDLLGELGYPRALPGSSSEKQEAAMRARRRFVDSLRSRRLPVPEGW